MLSIEGWFFISAVCAGFIWVVFTGIRGILASLDTPQGFVDRYRIYLCPSHSGRILTEEEGRDLWRTA